MIAALHRRLMAPMPAERLALLRIAVGGFALVLLLTRARAFAGFGAFGPEQFMPAGPVALLATPLPAWAPPLLVVLTIALGAAFVVGWRFSLTGPLFALGFLWVSAYRSSFGMLFHTENLLALHLFVLGAARSADALSVDAGDGPGGDAAAYGWPVRVLCIATVLVYTVAGVAKLQEGGLAWALGDELRKQIAWDALRKHLVGSVYSPVGAFLVGHPWIFPPVASATLTAELLGPLALLDRRATLVWCAVIWGFHVGVLALMAIVFPYPLSGIAFAPFFPVERVLTSGAARRLLPRLRHGGGRS